MKIPRLMSPTCRHYLFAAVALLALCAPVSAQSAFVFDDTVVRTYQIEVSAQDWDDILNNRLAVGEYRPCTWRFGGEEYRDVQIRLRGESSRDLDGGAKPNLKVKFRNGQRFYNMKAISLDHLGDAAQMSERLSYGIYNRRGVNAPRYADARINLRLGSAEPSYLGLFGVEELIDEGFLTRRFDDDRGRLYRMRPNSDPFVYLGEVWGTYVPIPFEPKTAFTTDHTALVDLVRTIADSPPDRFRERVGTRMSLSTLMEYIAVESVIGEADGYLADFDDGIPFYNNTFFYQLPADGRFYMITWDRDSSFNGVRLAFSVLRGLERSNLTRWMWADGPSRAEYLSRCREIAEQQLNPSILLPELDRVYQQIRPHVLEDRNKPVTDEQFEQAVVDLRQFIRQRYENVMREVQ